MELENAKQLLNDEQGKRESLDLAKQTVIEEQKRKMQEEMQLERERKREESEEFIAKIPARLCVPFTKCWKCKRTIELGNKEGLRTTQGDYRVVTCDSCGCFNIDKLDLTGATNVGKLLPYAIKLE